MSARSTLSNPSLPPTGAPKLVDPLTKRDLILLLYRTLESKAPKPNYGTMHTACKQMQEMLVKEFHVTLGYKFEDSSIHKVWDEAFQRDIERYDAQAKLVQNHDKPLSEGYYTHELSLREYSRELLSSKAVRHDIEEKIGSFDKLVAEITKINPQ